MFDIYDEEYDFFNYNDSILLIELNENGRNFGFQYDGTSCLYANITGNIIASFKSKSKYFNPDLWYHNTRWFLDEGLLCFTWKGKPKEIFNNYCKTGFNEAEKKFNIVQKQLRPYTISSEQVLNEILKEVNNNLDDKVEFNEDNTNYGKTWWEAYIPVIYKNKRCILTWENCD